MNITDVLYAKKLSGGGGGGSGIDVPIFTFTSDEQTEEMFISCNKTYAECYAVLDPDNPNRNASALSKISGENEWFGMTGISYPSNELEYFGVDNAGRVFIRVLYESDGTITFLLQ